MDYVLKTNQLSKQYGNFYAVQDVNMTIEKGEIYGLIGENGAGKSTFMKMIAGLAKPSAGNIELFGNPISNNELCRIGCTIEAPALYMELSAKQNLEVYRKAYGLTDKKTNLQILEQMDLISAKDKIVKKYSLGMKQRLAIGIALLGNPDFLVLDEPINGLDPTGIQEMRDFLLKLNKEKHITILLSSHILGELSKIATKYGIFKIGKLIDEITAKNLEEQCQCCLKLKVSDIKQTAVVLEKQFNTISYEIVDDNTIRVFNYVDDPGTINTTLVKAGITIFESAVSKNTLEDYFNNKMRGGIKNA